MDPIVFLLILCAAFMHATWNSLIKSGGDPWIRLGIVISVSGLIGLLFAPFVAFPDAKAWPYLAASVAIHLIYFVGICQGYRFGDLSQVYPLQRGIAPMLVAIGSYLLIGERLSVLGIIAVIIISFSILSLALNKSTEKKWTVHNAPAVLIALFTGSMIALYSVSDGIGGRLSGDVFGYIVWLEIFDAVFFIPMVITHYYLSPKRAVKRHLKTGFIGGGLSFIAYGLVIWAMSIVPLTYVSALRESSVIIAAWIGSRFLNEPMGPRRIMASVIAMIGIVLLQLNKL